jgi:anti-anti-sigma regulatory factor
MARREGAWLMRIAGDFSGAAVRELWSNSEFEAGYRGPLIVDLSQCANVGADGAGLIAGLATEPTRDGVQVWLVGVQPKVRKALRAIFPGGHGFRVAATVREALLVLDTESRSSVRPRAYAPAGEDWPTFSLTK